MGKSFLDGSEQVWKDNVKYLGNFVDITCNDDIDCKAKKIFVHCFFQQDND